VWKFLSWTRTLRKRHRCAKIAKYSDTSSRMTSNFFVGLFVCNLFSHTTPKGNDTAFPVSVLSVIRRDNQRYDIDGNFFFVQSLFTALFLIFTNCCTNIIVDKLDLTNFGHWRIEQIACDMCVFCWPMKRVTTK
jgi:hypothetical protein